MTGTEIYMVEYAVESNGSSGYFTDWYINPDYGYFLTREDAERELTRLRDGERARWERQEAAAVAEAQKHIDRRDRALAARATLAEQGLDPDIIPVPYARSPRKPRPWDPASSEFRIVTVERGTLE